MSFFKSRFAPMFRARNKNEPTQEHASLSAAPERSGVGINDVLATSYLSAQAPSAATTTNTALLLIDIQHLSEPAYLHSKAVTAGLDGKAVDQALQDYERRFDAALLNCAKVLEASRQSGIVPIHVKIQSLEKQARDTGPLHRRMGWQFPPGSAATRFLEPTAPATDEIVITKTASGAFTGTALEATLRNMGIEHLRICGFVTDECVETTARVALDLGFVVKVISDATTTYHAEAYNSTIEKFSSFGFAATADDVISEFLEMSS
ncbi:MAG: cysteine hydrolase family protein [Parvularcula sp.]